MRSFSIFMFILLPKTFFMRCTKGTERAHERCTKGMKRNGKTIKLCLTNHSSMHRRRTVIIIIGCIESTPDNKSRRGDGRMRKRKEERRRETQSSIIKIKLMLPRRESSDFSLFPLRIVIRGHPSSRILFIPFYFPTRRVGCSSVNESKRRPPEVVTPSRRRKR